MKVEEVMGKRVRFRVIGDEQPHEGEVMNVNRLPNGEVIEVDIREGHRGKRYWRSMELVEVID